jgi:hypothetical protein
VALFVPGGSIEPSYGFDNTQLSLGQLPVGRRECSEQSFRDELLNGEIFYSLKEAQVVIEQRRKHYNTVKRHSSLGNSPLAP